jgi:hypothetical protein
VGNFFPPGSGSESGSADLVESGSESKTLIHAYMKNSVSDTDSFNSNLDKDFLLNSDQNCVVEKNIFNNALSKNFRILIQEGKNDLQK